MAFFFNEKPLHELFFCNDFLPLYKCSSCSLRCNEKVQISNHVCETRFNYVQVKSKFCEQCKAKSFSVMWHYFHSIQCNFQKAKLNGKGHKCDQCLYSTSRKRSLLRHQLSKHTPVDFRTYLQCDQCDAKYLKMRNLHLHKLYKHTPSDLLKWLHCDKCTYKTMHHSYLRLHHEFKHSIGKKIGCDHCSFTTHAKRYLGRHHCSLHSTNLSKTHYCTLCNFKTTSKRNLKFHMVSKYHKREKDMKCEKCTFETYTEKGLAQHIKYKHAAPEKQYQCDQCTYATHDSRSLRDHKINKHLSENEITFYNCTKCQCKYKLKKRLTVHMQVKHSNDGKGIKCDQCSFVTSWNYQLKKHKAMQHPEHLNAPLKCKICDFNTVDEIYFRKHIKTVHEKVA